MFNEKEFNSIANKYDKAIFSYCLYRLSYDVPLTEETVSDVFVTLYMKWDTLDKGGNIKAWLYRTADNCIARARRSMEKQVKTVSMEELMENGETVSAERDIDITEIEYLSMLPPKYREIFSYKYIHRMKEKEISELTGTPITTVRSRLEKAKELIIKNL